MAAGKMALVELGLTPDLVVPLNRGTPIKRPQYTIALTIRATKMVPLILGSPHLLSEVYLVLKAEKIAS